MIDFYLLHARERMPSLHPEWEPYEYRVIGDRENESRALVKVTGAVAPICTRGPRKGRRNWQKMDSATRKEFYFGIREHREFVDKWERDTGTCKQCTGEGKTVKIASVDGTTYRECDRCGGTGKRPQ